MLRYVAGLWIIIPKPGGATETWNLLLTVPFNTSHNCTAFAQNNMQMCYIGLNVIKQKRVYEETRHGIHIIKKSNSQRCLLSSRIPFATCIVHTTVL